MSLNQLTDQQLQEAIASGDSVLVLYRSTFCTPCHTIAGQLEAVAPSLRGEMAIASVNIDLFPQTAAPLELRAVPAIVLYKDGEPITVMRTFVACQSFIEILSHRTK
ncbi:thioredoxin family protein [Paenibacillus glycanilyticus]|uniref:thioredoxin family protein n=1 Tax=Paenibacillus glycanilyticus TaxID=126569 RepID=UPI00203C7C30|nr:thioredoxin domain-containing protein [Paenibacillus glycanilyticus]MCM3630713.1 thioredoxin family protein [Paenibacillus glycanilyticus]